MRYRNNILVCTVILIIIMAFSFAPPATKKMAFIIPDGWPRPVYQMTKIPLTEEGFQLGRRLFYDPILSRDSTISCSGCHLQATGFTHIDHALSHGIDGRFGTRNTPALMNLAWRSSYMWDGGVNHLEVQPISPITNPLEMDEQLDHVVAKMNASTYYKNRFQIVFGDPVVTGQRLLLALTEFVMQLNSYNSRYDRYMRKEAGGELNAQELNGLQLFRAHCNTCHTEPLFTNEQFENTGLQADLRLNDSGRMRITRKSEDSLKFKVPTLRNIQYTQPYMHDGRFKTLYEVINHYTEGIHQSKTLSEKLKKPIQLSANEKVDLVAFLFTLTDKEFLYDPRFMYPRE